MIESKNKGVMSFAIKKNIALRKKSSHIKTDWQKHKGLTHLIIIM